MAELTSVSPPPRSAWLQPLPVALALVFLGGVFYFASRSPLSGVDTWAHWKYGEWIWQHQRLPKFEPFTMYGEKKLPAIDLWWLSQVVCYLIYSRFGVEGIALFYAAATTLKGGLYLAAFRRACGSWWLALAGLALVFIAQYPFFGIARPQAFGEVFWAALLLICAVPRPSWHTLVAVPLLTALWANCHGAFVLAPLLLAIRFIGAFLERSRALHGFTRAGRDPVVRLWFLASVLAVAGAAVNPYGPKLLFEALNFGNKYPSLQVVIEWQPAPPLSRYSSKVFLSEVALVLITLRLSPRRFSVADVLLLGLLGVSSWWTSRAFLWWTSVCPFVLLPHWAAILQRWGLREPAGEASPRAYRLGIGAAGLLAGVVLLVGSDSGRWLLAGQPRPEERLLSDPSAVRVARGLAAWLDGDAASGARPPVRLLVYPDSWMEYAIWELPPRAQVFWYSHWHLIPRDNVTDGSAMLDLQEAPVSWRTALERHRINAVALTGELPKRALFDYLWEQGQRPDGEWQIVYREGDDPPSVLVAVRRTDPFALALTGADGAYCCVGGPGLTPLPGSWGFLGHLPWAWPQARTIKP